MLEHKKIEEEVKALWKKIDLLKELQMQNEENEPYFLLDGPPYANYVPHVGHVRNTVFKDLYIRIAFMRGHNVLFQPGFDTHGLPIENMIEKKLNLTNKKQIEEMGVSSFVKLCRESAALNKDLWLEVYGLLGSWYSWKEPYLTYNNSYLQSAWWAFKQIWDKGMVYEGKKSVHWCPHCQTALSGYEVTDSYKNVTDPRIFVKFKVKGTENDFFLVFTTTPWTLPGNVAVVAHPDKDYVKAQTDKGNLILAKNRLVVLDEIGLKYTVIEEFKGKDLDGKHYENILDVPVSEEVNSNPVAHRVYMSIPLLKERVASKVSAKMGLDKTDLFEDFVSVDDGTGLVHCAPGHGKSDYFVGIHYGLPAPSPLDDECKFTKEVGKYKGQFVKEADSKIIEELESTGNMLYHDKITHSYPLCWRCKNPLIFRLSSQWFMKVDFIKDEMLEANEEVNWQPDFARERFRNWVMNAEDWNFSRQRYWGIPIPIWKCECGEVKVIGSMEDLRNDAVEEVAEDFDLHSASEVHLKCSCGKNMSRVHDIFDVWYDSGVAPFASLGYPFQNKELFETNFPVSRINESQDQIRGWFYSLMFANMAVFGEAPYETVSMPGWVVDAKGDKMSKSVGNVVWAKDALEKYGADTLRFYYCWDIAPYELQKFNVEILSTEVPKMLNILWNLAKYVLSNTEGPIDDLPEMNKAEDRWIISRLHSVIEESRNAAETFEVQNYGRSVYNFIVNDLSRTYVQFTRSREDGDNIRIIGHCLLQAITLMAPITPFISEKIYQDFKEKFGLSKPSVHMLKWPIPDKALIDLKAEEEFDVLKDTVQAILAAREKANIGVRWPVSEVVIETNDSKVVSALSNIKDIVMQYTNVKSLTVQKEFTDAKVTIKANYKLIGPELGADAPKVIAAIANESSASILKRLDEGKGSFEMKLGGKSIVLKDGYFIKEKSLPDNYTSSEMKSGSVYLNKSTTRDLLSEGYAREMIRRVQTLRKDKGFVKSDLIDLHIQAAAELKDHLLAHEEDMKQKVGARSLKISADPAPTDLTAGDSGEIRGLKFTTYFGKV